MKELPVLSGKYSYADLQEAIAHVSDRKGFPLYKCRHPLAVQIISKWLGRYFEKEPHKEPFSIYKASEGWYLQYTPDGEVIVIIQYEYDAKIACEVLNKCWNRGEQ